MYFISFSVSRKLSPQQIISMNNQLSKTFLFVSSMLELGPLSVQSISIQIGHFSYKIKATCGQLLTDWTMQISHLGLHSSDIPQCTHFFLAISHTEFRCKHLYTQHHSHLTTENADMRVRHLLVSVPGLYTPSVENAFASSQPQGTCFHLIAQECVIALLGNSSRSQRQNYATQNQEKMFFHWLPRVQINLSGRLQKMRMFLSPLKVGGWING